MKLYRHCEDPDRDDIDSSDNLVKIIQDEVFKKDSDYWKLVDAVGKLNCPLYLDGENSLLDKTKPKSVKGKLDEQIDALVLCHRVYERLTNARKMLERILSKVNDMALGLTNSFGAEYDMDIFGKGWAYQNKFLRNIKHYSCSGAEESWKKEYDECVKLFKTVTDGLECHNFSIGVFNDGTEGLFYFTVKGCPGDFEISFPTIVEGWGNDESNIRGDEPPMQIRITWRRRWYIPVFDYFFDKRSSYHVADINRELRKFVENEEWREFVNKINFDKGRYDADKHEYVQLTEDEKKKVITDYEELLKEEIEDCGKDGKKRHSL